VTSQAGDLHRSVTSSPFVDVIAALRRRNLNRSNDVITPHDDDVIVTAVPTEQTSKTSDEKTADDSDAAADDRDDDVDDDDEYEDEELDSPTEQRLMRHLLRRYERAVRPVRNASDTVIARMGLTLTQIFNMVSPVSHSVLVARSKLIETITNNSFYFNSY